MPLSDGGRYRRAPLHLATLLGAQAEAHAHTGPGWAVDAVVHAYLPRERRLSGSAVATSTHGALVSGRSPSQRSRPHLVVLDGEEAVLYRRSDRSYELARVRIGDADGHTAVIERGDGVVLATLYLLLVERVSASVCRSKEDPSVGLVKSKAFRSGWRPPLDLRLAGAAAYYLLLDQL